jgi:hypothetical protein
MTSYLKARTDAWDEANPICALASSSGTAADGTAGGGTEEGGRCTPASMPAYEAARRLMTGGAVLQQQTAAALPSPAPASSTGESNGGDEVPSNYMPNRAFLLDSLHYLLFNRLLLDHRKSLLERVENSVHEWLSRFPKDSSRSRSGEKSDAILSFQQGLEGEKRALVAACEHLPPCAQVEQVLKLRNKILTQSFMTSGAGQQQLATSAAAQMSSQL